MKKIIVSVLCLLIAASVFTACSRQQSGSLTIRDGVFMVGMDIGYPPMEFFAEDGETPMGFDVEMAKAIAAKLGLQVQFIEQAWEGIFDGVETGRYDAVISAVTITPARQEVHNFSRPYIANALAIVLLKDSGQDISNPMDLAGLDVAFQSDTTSDHYMERLRLEQGLNYIARRYPQVMHCFEDLRLGRVHAIMTDLVVAHDYIAPADTPFEVVWIGDDDPEEFGICIRGGNDALTDAINNALEELFEDGTMRRISMQFFGVDLVSIVR